MEKAKKIGVSAAIAILFAVNLYFLYALFDMNKKLYASGFACKETPSAYNFSGALNTNDLPDMAGGC